MVITACNKVTRHGFGGVAVGPGNLIAPAGGCSRHIDRNNA